LTLCKLVRKGEIPTPKEGRHVCFHREAMIVGNACGAIH
jgi:excisionase family DNA binding protein